MIYNKELIVVNLLIAGKTMYYSSNQYFHKGTIPGHTMTFSSYPGTLMSGDDYYLISSGLVGLIVKGD